MVHFRKHWVVYSAGLLILFIIIGDVLLTNKNKKSNSTSSSTESIIPRIDELSSSEADQLIIYGKKLIDSTAKYFGPHGSIASITNGLNCGGCHRESGTKLYTNNFLLVTSTYPKFRERSGRLESVEFRINDCMQRSLDGRPIDSLSREMRAMVAYINWTGKNVHKNEKEEGTGTKELALLSIAADPIKGKTIYEAKCKICHGENGQGVMNADSLEYTYPPLWGEHSYAVSAGMYRITKLASFIKNNMPFGATYKAPQLSDQEAWSLAAFINSQPHPNKMFASDWPVLSTKPYDYPFGPYADAFSESQHRYGPFEPIKKSKSIK
jgi:thiosulfate dehydrogenase